MTEAAGFTHISPLIRLFSDYIRDITSDSNVVLESYVTMVLALSVLMWEQTDPQHRSLLPQSFICIPFFFYTKEELNLDQQVNMRP